MCEVCGDCSHLLKQDNYGGSSDPLWRSQVFNTVSDRLGEENTNPFRNHTPLAFGMLLALLRLGSARWLPAAVTKNGI